jgi:hypothetical protein
LPSSPDEPVEIVHVAPDCGIGTWRHFVLVVWQGKPTAQSVRALHDTYVRRARAESDGFWAFGAIEAGVAQPDAPERTAIADAMNAAGSAMRGSVVALEAKGFVAATIRTALGAMIMMTRAKFPRAFVATVDEAAHWMRARAPGAEDPRVLVERFEELRRVTRTRTAR